jgi:hypothetical protein
MSYPIPIQNITTKFSLFIISFKKCTNKTKTIIIKAYTGKKQNAKAKERLPGKLTNSLKSTYRM